MGRSKTFKVGLFDLDGAGVGAVVIDAEVEDVCCGSGAEGEPDSRKGKEEATTSCLRATNPPLTQLRFPLNPALANLVSREASPPVSRIVDESWSRTTMFAACCQL